MILLRQEHMHIKHTLLQARRQSGGGGSTEVTHRKNRNFWVYVRFAILQAETSSSFVVTVKLSIIRRWYLLVGLLVTGV